jgi:tryptophanyl-tRNA synthetase
LFASKDRANEVHNLYTNGGAAYGYIKLELFELISEYFSEARRRKTDFLSDPEELRRIMKKGADKAREKATITLDIVRDRVGLKY